MKTDVALDLHNVDPALDLLHHHKKQIDPYGLYLHYRFRLHLTSERQLLHLHRLLIKTLGRRVIQAKIMTGTHAEHIVFIPRIVLTTTKDYHLPFTLTRRQFPIKPSLTMTINKSQRQTLTIVGIYLPQSVFTHVDPAFDLLHHHKKQIDPYELDLHHRFRLHLTSDRQLLHLHRQLPQTMTISILLPTSVPKSNFNNNT